MHQHHAVVRHRAVRAPVPAPRECGQAVGARVAHGTQVVRLVHHGLLRSGNQVLVKVGGIERHAECGKHVHVAPPGAIRRERILLQVILIVLFLCRAVEFSSSPAELVLAILVTGHVAARLHVIGLLVNRLRVLLRPGICAFCRLEHLVGIGLVDVPVDNARLRHHGCKVKRGGHVLDNRIARRDIVFGQHAPAELQGRHLVVNTAVLVL